MLPLTVTHTSLSLLSFSGSISLWLHDTLKGNGAWLGMDSGPCMFKVRQEEKNIWGKKARMTWRRFQKSVNMHIFEYVCLCFWERRGAPGTEQMSVILLLQSRLYKQKSLCVAIPEGLCTLFPVFSLFILIPCFSLLPPPVTLLGCLSIYQTAILGVHIIT